MDHEQYRRRLRTKLNALAERHGFAKVPPFFEKTNGDAILMFARTRFRRLPADEFAFNVDLYSYAPLFHQKVYGQSNASKFAFQIHSTLPQLAGGSRDSVWASSNTDDFLENLLEMERLFNDLAIPFLEKYSVLDNIAEACREGVWPIRKRRDLAIWEAGVFDGKIDPNEPRPERDNSELHEALRNMGFTVTSNGGKKI